MAINLGFILTSWENLEYSFAKLRQCQKRYIDFISSESVNDEILLLEIDICKDSYIAKLCCILSLTQNIYHLLFEL